MKKEPLVTVFTPTFNREHMLGETIDSILSQDYPNFEYLILDDGSTDGTRELVRKYGERIKYVYQKNQGERAAINTGWTIACGDYFAAVSSDDLMRPRWLSSCIELLEANPDVVVAYPDWTVIDQNSLPVQDVPTFDYSQENMISWFYAFPGPGAVMRRSSLKSMGALRDTSFYYCSDMLMWFRLSLRGRFARVAEPLATWRQHQGSITVKGCTLERARELVRMAGEFFLTPDMPQSLRSLESSCRGRAYAVAAALTKDSHPYWSYYFRRRMEALKCWDESSLPEMIRMGNFVELGDLLARRSFAKSSCPHPHKNLN